MAAAPQRPGGQSGKGLAHGDPAVLAMAARPEVAAALLPLLPPGPVLELCCGAGGITRALAADGHRVVAVDRDPARLAANRANLAASGLAGRVTYLCADLSRPIFRNNLPRPFTAAVLDPDWSPPGRPPENWAKKPAGMEPPADALLTLALCLAPLAALRLPPGMETRGLPAPLPLQPYHGWHFFAV